MRWAALLAVAVVVAGAAPAASAPDRIAWTANGPDGGGASYIEIDPRSPSTLYVGTTLAGVFRSTNSGRTVCQWDYRYGNPYVRQQLSNSACVEGRDWGYTRDGGLWVTSGCRGVFGYR